MIQLICKQTLAKSVLEITHEVGIGRGHAEWRFPYPARSNHTIAYPVVVRSKDDDPIRLLGLHPGAIPRCIQRPSAVVVKVRNDEASRRNLEFWILRLLQPLSKLTSKLVPVLPEHVRRSPGKPSLGIDLPLLACLHLDEGRSPQEAMNFKGHDQLFQSIDGDLELLGNLINGARALELSEQWEGLGGNDHLLLVESKWVCQADHLRSVRLLAGLRDEPSQMRLQQMCLRGIVGRKGGSGGLFIVTHSQSVPRDSTRV